MGETVSTTGPISTALIAAVALSPLALPLSTISAQSLPARTDSVMRSFVASDAPGCAVAIDSASIAIHRGAYGLAELEYRVPISNSTIFEAGSVSKQFVAAAVLLLEKRGVLSLDDTLQKWFPEIPVYEQPITIRHLMLHTSGLRDWGSVRGLAGWPRWTASYTHGDALAIIARQHGLNHLPGEAYSYTNTGYNLMAMLVERATRQRFTTFTQREFFEPLGMSSTSWRDDYRRIVPNRAQAYSRSAGQWRLDMPFEHVYGNGGLLTTVDDLIKWNRALTEGRVGSPDVSAVMQQSGLFNDGREVGYGCGLQIGTTRGVRSISHGGSTAGYRAALARFPDQSISIAILCNRGDANPVAMVETILEGTLPFGPAPNRQPATLATPAPISFDATDFVGTWYSEEVDGTLTFNIQQGRLMVERRPGDTAPLTIAAVDRFVGPGTLELVFGRDETGAVNSLTASVSRANGIIYRRRR
jgi:CubicO group peptidase (beta-lactamase class C family)